MKIIKRGQEARDALKRGIDLVADCVKVTLGPSGRNAVLGRQDITPIITNDGVTIARNIEAEDPIENQGVWIVKEAASIADMNGGDGTTTTTVLLQAIVEELFEKLKDNGSMVKNKIDSIKLKKEIDICCEKIVEKLNQKARPITDDDIYKVALVSAEYDWIAKMVAEIWQKIGKDGYIELEEGVKTSYEIFPGVSINAGYPSEYFITKEDKCIIENPYILITNQRIDTNAIGPLGDLFTALAQKNIKELVIIAPEFSRDVLSRLITTKLKADFSAVALKLPTFDKDEVLVDIATLTQAKFLDKNIYAKSDDFFADFKIENLGRGERAVVGSSKTRILGGRGDTTQRVAEIKRIYEETQSAFDKDTLEKRIAGLSGGMAIVRVGGETEFERNYFKLKTEDAINAVQYALKFGVVKGGGLALKEISEDLPDNILSKSIVAPYFQIQENSGGIEIGDDVIDPVKTTISALRAACSIAGTLITTEVVVAYKSEKNEPKN